MRRILNYTAQEVRCICENANLFQMERGLPKGKCPADTALRMLDSWCGKRGIYWSNRALAHMECAQAAVQNRAGRVIEIFAIRKPWITLQPCSKSSVPPISTNGWRNEPHRRRTTWNKTL
jgi:hypothetical protein